mgnify:CR=1 FL=1
MPSYFVIPEQAGIQLFYAAFFCSFASPSSGPAPPAAAAPTPAPEPTVRVAQAPIKPAAPASAAPQSASAGPATTSAPADVTINAQLKSRKVTYNRPPQTLVLDKGIDLSLIIDSTGQNQAAERLKDLPGTIVERDVKLSDNVAAELVGRDFDIQLQSAASRQKHSGSAKPASANIRNSVISGG